MLQFRGCSTQTFLILHGAAGHIAASAFAPWTAGAVRTVQSNLSR
jgi:hypothetical protein